MSSTGIIVGAIINPKTYGLTVSQYIQAANQLDGYLGQPQALAKQKWYLTEGEWGPFSGTPLKGLRDLIAAGCKILLCAIPVRTTDPAVIASEQASLASFISSMQSAYVSAGLPADYFEITLDQEPNAGTKFPFVDSTGNTLTYQQYWANYAPTVRAAGIPCCYNPAINPFAYANAVSFFHGLSPLPDIIYVDYYGQTWLNSVYLEVAPPGISHSILSLALDNGLKFGIGEYGSASGGGSAPALTQPQWNSFTGYLISILQQMPPGKLADILYFATYIAGQTNPANEVTGSADFKTGNTPGVLGLTSMWDIFAAGTLPLDTESVTDSYGVSVRAKNSDAEQVTDYAAVHLTVPAADPVAMTDSSARVGPVAVVGPAGLLPLDSPGGSVTAGPSNSRPAYAPGILGLVTQPIDSDMQDLLYPVAASLRFSWEDQWHVLAAGAPSLSGPVTRPLDYHGPAGPVAVATRWNLANAVSSSVLSSWNCTTAVSPPAGSAWNTLQAVTSSVGSSWNTFERVSLVTVTSPVLPGPVTRPLDSSAGMTVPLAGSQWDITSRASATIRSAWNTLQAGTSSVGSSWLLFLWFRMPSRVTSWSTLFRTSSSGTLGFAARTLIPVSAALSWNEDGHITTTAYAKWNAQARGSGSGAFSWNALQLIPPVNTGNGAQWNTLLAVTAQPGAGWAVLQRVASSAADCQWGTVARASASAPLAWGVITRFPATASCRWQAIRRASSSRTCRWRALNPVTAPAAAAAWNTRLRSPGSCAGAWETLKRRFKTTAGMHWAVGKAILLPVTSTAPPAAWNTTRRTSGTRAGVLWFTGVTRIPAVTGCTWNARQQVSSAAVMTWNRQLRTPVPAVILWDTLMSVAIPPGGDLDSLSLKDSFPGTTVQWNVGQPVQLGMRQAAMSSWSKME